MPKPHSDRFRPAIQLSAAFFAALLSAQAVTFTDSAFSQVNWTDFIASSTGGANMTITASGFGNPTVGQRNDFSAPQLTNGQSANVVALTINQTFVYNPSVSGAIGSLSFSYDLMFLGSTGITGASSGFYRPALRQGGINYVLFVPFDSTTSSGWTTFTHLSGSPLEWNDPTGTLHPDFSATGGAISFGYRVGFGVSCGSTQCSAATSVGVLDNYVVQIDGIPETSGVPEPASMWLAATSLALLRAVRKI